MNTVQLSDASGFLRPFSHGVYDVEAPPPREVDTAAPATARPVPTVGVGHATPAAPRGPVGSVRGGNGGAGSGTGGPAAVSRPWLPAFTSAARRCCSWKALAGAALGVTSVAMFGGGITMIVFASRFGDASTQNHDNYMRQFCTDHPYAFPGTLQQCIDTLEPYLYYRKGGTNVVCDPFSPKVCATFDPPATQIYVGLFAGGALAVIASTIVAGASAQLLKGERS